MVRSGARVSLRCCAARTAAPASIRWTRNGAAVTEDDGGGVRVSEDGETGELTIRAFDKSRHEGAYRCAVTNAVGTIVSREARIQQACKYCHQLQYSWDSAVVGFSIHEIQYLLDSVFAGFSICGTQCSWSWVFAGVSTHGIQYLWDSVLSAESAQHG